MGKVIALCNQKGGVGKTTTAVNLATYIAMLGKETLLIDMDPQGNGTSGLGIDKNGVKWSIYNVLLGEIEIIEAIIKTGIDRLSIVPSNLQLTGAEVELVNMDRREERLRIGIGAVRDSYDYILIDSPPSLGLLTVNALNAADSVIVPVQCEYYALEGLSQLLNAIELVRKNLNPSLVIEGVLLTMADYRTNLTQQVIDEVEKFFKDKVYKAIIPRNIRLSEAPGFGKPIELYDPESIGAQRYKELAREIVGLTVSTNKC